jgi:radical SAM superfamily enzyme YgiQ (UPF0313 family)
MKILLIHGGSGELEIAEKVYINAGALLPPLGLLYISSILEQEEHETVVIDCTAEKNPKDEIKKQLVSCDAVGLTTYCHPYELEKSIEYSKYIRSISPDIPIIVGGPHTSLLPRVSLDEHVANIAITGRAENLIIPVIEGLEGKRSFDSIPDIYYRKGKKIIYNNKSKNDIKIFDDLPLPSLSKVEKYEYGHILGVKIAEGKLASISTSEGCVYNCKFCNLHSHLPVFKARTIEKVIDEIDYVVDQGYKTIVFVDDNFMTNKQRVKKIMDYIIESGCNVKIWIFGARADSAEKPLWEKMKRAGVENMNFGLESGSQKILDFYNKKLSIEQSRKAIQLSKKMGFFVQANFMIGAPIETRESIEETINFAKSIPADIAIFYLFTYTYKSELWNDAVKKGLIKKDEYRVAPDNNRGIGNFSNDELLNYINIAYKDYYLNPKYVLRELKWITKNSKYKYLKLGIRLLKTAKNYS